MKVSKLMTRRPVKLRRDASLDVAMQLMDERDVRHLLVLDDDQQLAGVLSDRDLLEATGWLSEHEREVLEAPEGCVGTFMQAPPVCVAPEAGLEVALALMIKRHIGSLPVVQNGALVGMITEMDVLGAYVRACREGLDEADGDPPVRDHMSPEPLTIQHDASGEEARALMRRQGLRHLPVLDDEVLVGILSDRDVRLFLGRGQLELTLVREMMSPDPRTVEPGDQLSVAAQRMYEHRISALPVLEDGRLAGLLTLMDLLIPCALRLMRR